MALLDKAKSALMIAKDVTAYDEDIQDLINAAISDLEIGGVTAPDDVDSDPLTLRAVLTYVRANFGSPDDYDRLQASYALQRAQLHSATGHTDWSVDL